MTPIAIRKYTPADLPFMVKMWESADRPSFNASQIEKLLESTGGVLVAVNDADEPVGTVLWSHNGYRAYVWRLVVNSEVRKQGIATSLLKAVESEVMAAGFEKLALLLLHENDAAKSLYIKLGWKLANDVEYWYKNLEEDPAKC